MKISVLNYARFYEHLDEAVRTCGVHNAAGFSVKGFPFLRANRFFTGIAATVIDDHQKNLWLELLRRYDLIERSKEIQNLSIEALAALESRMPKKFSSRKELFEKLVFYSERYLQAERARGKLFERVRRAAVERSVYSLPMRIFGLYPLAYPVAVFCSRIVYRQIRRWHIAPLEALPIQGELISFAAGQRIDPASVPLRGMLEQGRCNSLGMPELSREELEIIARSFAPVLTIDVAKEYDRFGALVWKDGMVAVDAAHPTVYYYPSYAIIADKPHLQLNYAFWYPARSGRNSPWIERGALDGMTVRVTLEAGGAPLIVDSMNNCGGYFFYVPHKERVAEVIGRPRQREPLIPSWLPAEYPAQPLRLRINTGWHQVQHVDAGMPAQSCAYDLAAYDILETLSHRDGRTESVFNKAGIMKDCRRIKPYLFFSFGIPKAGYMRQRGNHAIKLAGRAHFTDARLYEKDFIFNEERAEKQREGLWKNS